MTDAPNINPATKQAIEDRKDELIREVITAHLGREDWSPAEVLPHWRRTIDPKSKVQTYSFGAKPLLEIYPPELQKNGRWNARFNKL